MGSVSDSPASSAVLLRRRRRAQVCLVAYGAAILTATLYPFRFTVPLYFSHSRLSPPTWDAQHGMVFSGLGMFTRAGNRPVDLRAIARTGSYYLYTEVQPSDPARTAYAARFFSCAPAGGEFGLFLAQDNRALILQVPTRVHLPYRVVSQHQRIPDVFREDGWYAILVYDDGAQLHVWINGESRGPYVRSPLVGRFWEDGNFLAAGNELLGRYGWQGRMRQLELGLGAPPAPVRQAAGTAPDSAQPAGSPLFRVDARRGIRPPHWAPREGNIWSRHPPQPWAAQPFRQRRWADAGLNILLFVPFGLCGAWYWKRVGPTVAAACMLSLSVEAIQMFLPARVCDSTDVLMNTFGGAAGALLLLHGLTRATRSAAPGAASEHEAAP